MDAWHLAAACERADDIDDDTPVRKVPTVLMLLILILTMLEDLYEANEAGDEPRTSWLYLIPLLAWVRS